MLPPKQCPICREPMKVMSVPNTMGTEEMYECHACRDRGEPLWQWEVTGGSDH